MANHTMLLGARHLLAGLRWGALHEPIAMCATGTRTLQSGSACLEQVAAQQQQTCCCRGGLEADPAFGQPARALQGTLPMQPQQPVPTAFFRPSAIHVPCSPSTSCHAASQQPSLPPSSPLPGPTAWHQQPCSSSPSHPASCATLPCGTTLGHLPATNIHARASYSTSTHNLHASTLATPAADIWGRANSSITLTHTRHALMHTRHASTLTKPGVPKPRPEVEAAMSTPRGGHLARIIYFTQTLQELDQALHRHASALQNVHWAGAALQLERLYRQERSSPFALRVKSIATRIETAIATAAPRLAVLHLSPAIRGLTGASHALSSDSLGALAAVLLVRDCAQLRLASDEQWKHLVWGFSMQGYTNPVFWEQLCNVAVGQLPRWDVNRVASVFKNMAMMGVRSDALTQAAMQRMVEQAHELKPLPLADALYAAVLVQRTRGGPTDPATSTDLTNRFVTALTARAEATLHQFDPKCCALFLHSLVQLPGAPLAAASQPPPQPSAAAAAPAGADGAGAATPAAAAAESGAVAVGAAAPRPLAARVAAVVLRDPSRPLHPLYVRKLLYAFRRLGYEDVAVTAGLARVALPLLGRADPGVRRALVEDLVGSVAGGKGEGVEEVRRLSKVVADLGDDPVQ